MSTLDNDDIEDLSMLIAVCATVKRIQARRKRRVRSIGVLPLWQKRREQGDGYHLMQELRFNQAMFFNYTRLNYERFDYLLGLCRPYLSKREMTTTIPADQRLSLTLRYLATGDNWRSIGLAYRCGFSTVSVIIREVLSVIVHVLHRLVVCEPRSKQAWRSVAQGFYEKWNLPHCLGAIDGRHMQIRAPKASGSQFFNYHKTYSMVLMAIADSDYSLIYADVGAEGSTNDAAILNNTEFWQRVKSGKMHLPDPAILPNSDKEINMFFVGDGIFALHERLMKPYALRKLSEPEAIYNYRLSRARKVVENSFGILVARWQCFRSPLICGLQTAEDITLARVCLHNFIIRSRADGIIEEYNPPQFVDVEQDDGRITPGFWRTMVVGNDGALQRMPKAARRGTVKATEMRKLLQDWVNNEGAVSWQVDRVRNGFWNAHITADIPEVEAARAEEDEMEALQAAVNAEGGE